MLPVQQGPAYPVYRLVRGPAGPVGRIHFRCVNAPQPDFDRFRRHRERIDKLPKWWRYGIQIVCAEYFFVGREPAPFQFGLEGVLPRIDRETQPAMVAHSRAEKNIRELNSIIGSVNRYTKKGVTLTPYKLYVRIYVD